MLGGLWDYARRLFGGTAYEVVGPDEPMSPEEVRLLFPRGVPEERHRGGLAELAARVPTGVVEDRAERSARRVQSGMPDVELQHRAKDGPRGGPGVRWYMGGIAERADLAKRDRELGAVENIGRFVGVLARLAATYGAGGAMGGGAMGGAGAGGAGSVTGGIGGGIMGSVAGKAGGAAGSGAAAGGAGAMAGAGAAGGGATTWSNFMQGLAGGGEGWSGMLGRGVRGMAESQAKGQLRRQSDSIADAVGTLTGRSQRRQAMWDLYLSRPSWWYY